MDRQNLLKLGEPAGQTARPAGFLNFKRIKQGLEFLVASQV